MTNGTDRITFFDHLGTKINNYYRTNMIEDRAIDENETPRQYSEIRTMREYLCIFDVTQAPNLIVD